MKADAPSTLYLEGRAAVIFFACFAWGYLLSFAIRSIGAVIAPGMTHDLDLSQAQLRFLTSGYFLAFGLMQLPLGILLDRYGVRRVQVALLVVAALGALMFASAGNFVVLWCGRALIGAGCAGCLMSAYKLFAERFPPERIARLSIWVLMAGPSGALLATVPASTALPLVGWRGLFVIAALLLVATALLLARFAPAPVGPHGGAGPISVAGQIADFKTIFSIPRLWPIFAIGTVVNGAFAANQTLWAGPWLATVAGMDANGVANALLLLNLAMLAGQVGFASVLGLIERRGIALSTVFASGVGLSLLAFGWIALGGSGAWPMLPWMLLGMTLCVTNLAFAIVVRCFPPALAGRASTTYNSLIFLGAFVLQWGMGVLLDAGLEAGLERIASFNFAFACVWVLEALALLWLLVVLARRTDGD